MSSALTLSLVLAVLYTGGVTAQRKLDTAPFNFSEASNVYQYSHHLSCRDDGIVLIGFVENGYKQRECQCDKDQHCCQGAQSDCLQDMSPEILQQVTLECWDKSECRPLVTKPKDSCWKNGVEFHWPTYSDAMYVCVPGNTVVDMTKQTSVSGAEVTARARPAGLPHSHTVTCSVQTVGGGQQTVGVSTVLGQGAPPLSCLSVGTETLCRENHAFTAFIATTPFNISLQQPVHSSLHYAWVRMDVDDGEICVSCSPGETTPSSTRAGTGSSGTPGTDVVTEQLVTSQSNDGVTSTSAPVSSSMLPDAADSTMVVGLTAGLAGALALALAASFALFFIFWRRRQRARGTGQETQPDQGGRIVLAELATARSDVTYESLRTEGSYQRLILPGGVGAPAGDVISAGQHDYDDCYLADVTKKDPNDVSRVEGDAQGVEESPYEVIEPSYVKEDVD